MSSSFVITKTIDVGDESVEALVRLVGNLGVMAESRGLGHKTLSEGPSFVSVLADIWSWKTLIAVPVTVFISQLAKNAADDIYKNKSQIAGALSKSAVKPLREIVALLMDIINSSRANPVLRIGIPLPDELRDTALELKIRSEEQLAVELAYFVASLDGIQTAIKDEVLKYGMPFGGIVVERKADGSYVLKWCGEDGNPRRLTVESDPG